MSIRERNRLNVTSRWKKIQAKEWQRTKKAVAKHPELKARILGYLAGDGSVSLDDGIRNRHNTLKFFPDHVSLLQPYCEAYVSKKGVRIQCVNEKGISQVRELLK